MTKAEQMKVQPKEGQEQATLINYARAQACMFPEEYPGLGMLMHIPNGGKRSASEAARFKAEGVQAGVPDLFLPVARGSYHGLWIEMKRKTGGTVSEYQKAWQKKLHEQGYAAMVAHGWKEAWEAISEYYGLGAFSAEI